VDHAFKRLRGANLLESWVDPSVSGERESCSPYCHQYQLSPTRLVQSKVCLSISGHIQVEMGQYYVAILTVPLVERMYKYVSPVLIPSVVVVGRQMLSVTSPLPNYGGLLTYLHHWHSQRLCHLGMHQPNRQKCRRSIVRVCSGHARTHLSCTDWVHV